MFSTLSKFHNSFSTSQPFFTDSSIELFPSSDTDSPTELTISDPIPTPVSTESALVDDLVPVRRSNRVREPPSHLKDYHCFSAIVSLQEPHSYREASINPLWQQAMAEELQALEKTHTWDLVDLPSSKTYIGCKWVYKIKTHFDGFVEHYKARLVAKGYTQEYGIDYEEIFAPIARLTSVRSLLVIAAVKNWILFRWMLKMLFSMGI